MIYVFIFLALFFSLSLSTGGWLQSLIAFDRPPSLDTRRRITVATGPLYSSTKFIGNNFSSDTTLFPSMANRNMQQTGMPSSGSPQPAKHRADSPAVEQPTPNKDSPAPQPQQPQQQQSPPAAEHTEDAGNGGKEGPTEMTLDITSFRKPGEKTFTQRCRLFVGSLPLDIPEEEFTSMFAKYGKVNEVFINRERGFGFIRLVSSYIQLVLYLYLINLQFLPLI